MTTQPGRLILPRDPVAAACAELIESARATTDAWHQPGPGARHLYGALIRLEIAVEAIDHLAAVGDAELFATHPYPDPPERTEPT